MKHEVHVKESALKTTTPEVIGSDVEACTFLPALAARSSQLNMLSCAIKVASPPSVTMKF